MKIPDIVLDGRTAKLKAVVKAFTLAEDLELGTARRWNDLATAIRMLAEAGEYTACRDLAQQMKRWGIDLEVEEPMAGWQGIIVAAAEKVVSATGPGRAVQ